MRHGVAPKVLAPQISVFNLEREMLGVMGWAAQTLHFHPEKVAQVKVYLRSEQNRLTKLCKARRDDPNILEREVIW